MPADAAPLRFRVTGGVRALRPAALRAASAATARGAGAARATSIELAIHEVLANALEHGHGADPRLPIGVEVAATGRVVSVTVTDHARGGTFAPRRTGEVVGGGGQAPALEGRAAGERGRGLELAASAVEELTVRRHARATRVSLWFTRRPQEDGSGADEGRRSGSCPDVTHRHGGSGSLPSAPRTDPS